MDALEQEAENPRARYPGVFAYQDAPRHFLADRLPDCGDSGSIQGEYPGACSNTVRTK
jgi:hypothetical protein